MAVISETFRAILKAESGITDIVDEVYVLAFPANPTFPLIVYRVISGAHILRSAPKVATTEKNTRFQVDTWAYDYDTTQDIKSVMNTLFDGYRGVINGQRIISTKIDLEFDQFEDDTGLYRYVCDVSVTHEGA